MFVATARGVCCASRSSHITGRLVHVLHRLSMRISLLLFVSPSLHTYVKCMASSPKLSNAALELLSRFGIDHKKDLHKNWQKFERVAVDEPNLSSEQRSALDAAWSAVVQDAQGAFDTKGVALMHVLKGYQRKTVSPDGTVTPPSSTERVTTPTAREFAEALSEMCFLSENFFSKTFRIVKCTFGAELGAVVPIALSSPSRVLRLLGLQTARLFIADGAFLHSFAQCKGFDWLGLCIDRESAQELEHACGFVLRCVELRSKERVFPEQTFPQGLAVRLASLLDPQDQLNSLVPSTRQRLVMVAVQVLEAFPAQAVGADMVRILLTLCSTRGTSGDELAQVLRVVLNMFDDPSRRSFLRDSDLAALLLPFVESPPKDTNSDYLFRMNHAKDAWARLLCTWQGLFWSASESMCLRSMIDLLHLPGPTDRKMVLLHMFNTIIRNVAPHRGIPAQDSWSGLASKHRSSTLAPMDFDLVENDEVGSNVAQGLEMYLERGDDNAGGEDDLIPTTKSIGYYTGDPICASLLLVLEHHGLPQALITIAKRSGSPGYDQDMTHEAVMLLQHLMILMDHLLPPTSVAQLHEAFTSAIASLHQENRLLVGTLTSKLFQNLNLSSSTAAAREVSGMSTPLLMDDTTFQTHIKESHVEQHNEPGRWNFDALLLLVQGPLRTPARVRWARDSTRFFTRVLGFYKPSAMKSFASLRREECNDQICGFGIAIVETLLATKEGTEILEKSEFPKALRGMLYEIVDDKAQPTILTWERIGPGASPIGLVFLLMLGRFTQSSNGLILLKRHGVLDIIKELLTKLSSGTCHASDLSFVVGHQLVQHLHIGSVPNYGVSEDLRASVKLAMENKDFNALRLCAMMQLRKILWKDLTSSMHWGIARLVEALSDPFFTVVEHSFRMLASICCSSAQALDVLIALKPTALVTSVVLRDNRKNWSTTSLLYRIAGRPDGCAFLQQAGWIDEELARWLASESQSHTDEVERLSQGRDCAVVTRQATKHSRSDSDAAASRRGHAGSRSRGVSFAVSHSSQNYFPMHFAGELCRTPEGCSILQQHPLWRDAVTALLVQVGGHEGMPDSPQNLQLDVTMQLWGNATLTELDTTPTPVRRLPQRHAPRDADDYADEVDELSFIRKRDNNTSRVAAERAEDPESNLLSAARGYEAKTADAAVDVTGDINTLKRSILVLCSVGSSNSGFEVLCDATPQRGELVQRLLDLSHRANCLSLRGLVTVAVAMLCRSPAAAAYLSDKQCAVVHLPSAYVSASGLPYSVAFAHPIAPTWMCVKRTAVHRGHAPRNAYREGSADTKDVPKEVADNVVALSNPVNRDAAKVKLHAAYKENPLLFADPAVQRLLLEVSSMYRMRSSERKFVVELLQRSMTRLPAS